MLMQANYKIKIVKLWIILNYIGTATSVTNSISSTANIGTTTAIVVGVVGGFLS